MLGFRPAGVQKWSGMRPPRACRRPILNATTSVTSIRDGTTSLAESEQAQRGRMLLAFSFRTGKGWSLRLRRRQSRNYLFRYPDCETP